MESTAGSELPAGVKSYDAHSLRADNIKKILLAQLGVKYSSNGETPEEGFSPVGLIKYVARKLGVEPKAHNAREAWERAGVFINVPYGQFKTGDLLFFKLFSKSAQKDELFIALALDNKYMVYPSYSRKKVIKRSYLDDFWKERFVGAKRVPIQNH
jgi:cell wall-associated NlpC family hydrolase